MREQDLVHRDYDWRFGARFKCGRLTHLCFDVQDPFRKRCRLMVESYLKTVTAVVLTIPLDYDHKDHVVLECWEPRRG